MRKIIITLVMLLTAFPADAQTVTREQYRERVLGYSQQLAISREHVTSAEAATKAAQVGFKPKVDAAADFNYMVKRINLELGTYGIPMKHETWGLNATAAQNVYAGGAVRKQVEAARIGAEQAGYGVMQTEDNVIYAAELSYWSMATAIAYRDAAYRYLSIIEDTYEIVNNRFEDGLISRNDLLMVQTRLQEARLRVSDAETGYTQALIAMNTLMGMPVDKPVAIADSINTALPPLPEILSLEEALEARPDYMIAKSNVRLGEQQLKLTRSRYLPSLAVGFTGQYATKSINIDGKGVGNGIAFAQLRVPIFNWNERKHKSAIDKSAIRISEEELSAAADEIARQMNDAYTRMTASYNDIETARGSVEVAQQSLSLNTFSYNEGLLTILDVLSAQLSWLSAYNNLIATNYNCRQAIADYMLATGRL